MGDLKLLQRCIEYRNELGRGLYYALKIGNDGCDDLRTEYESNEFSVPFERMEQMAGDVTPYDIYGFFRELNSIVWSFSCNNRVPDVSLKLLGSLERQQALLEGQRDALDADTSARLEHIVDVALSSALMISHVRQNEELDAPILDSYRELYAKLFADGAIDEDEAMTMDIMDRIINDRLINAPPVGAIDRALEFIQFGIELPETRRAPVFVSEHAPFYANRGRTPKRYSDIPEGDRRLEGRITDWQCYSFALTKYGDRWDAREELRENYEPVDLRWERAKKGDVVLYTTPTRHERKSVEDGTYEPFSKFEHLAVVTEVDKKGFPTKVMSKIGTTEHIYEHPVDEAPIKYGIIWTVYRKKK